MVEGCMVPGLLGTCTSIHAAPSCFPPLQLAWEEVVGAAAAAAAEKHTPLLHDPDVLGQLIQKMQVGVGRAAGGWISFCTGWGQGWPGGQSRSLQQPRAFLV